MCLNPIYLYVTNISFPSILNSRLAVVVENKRIKLCHKKPVGKQLFGLVSLCFVSNSKNINKAVNTIYFVSIYLLRVYMLCEVIHLTRWASGGFNLAQAWRSFRTANCKPYPHCRHLFKRHVKENTHILLNGYTETIYKELVQIIHCYSAYSVNIIKRVYN